ncbi:MAG: hypothetical protein H0X33_03290 [Taibaiella sp.]|nr:hypothetical protein [Taibaiella sp.]
MPKQLHITVLLLLFLATGLLQPITGSTPYVANDTCVSNALAPTNASHLYQKGKLPVNTKLTIRIKALNNISAMVFPQLWSKVYAAVFPIVEHAGYYSLWHVSYTSHSFHLRGPPPTA